MSPQKRWPHKSEKKPFPIQDITLHTEMTKEIGREESLTKHEWTRKNCSWTLKYQQLLEKFSLPYANFKKFHPLGIALFVLSVIV